MGNNYRTMVDITLTCRLFKDIEPNSEEFTINVNTDDYIANFKDKILEKVKRENDDFLEILADDLQLWKVEINNDDGGFSNLILENDIAKI